MFIITKLDVKKNIITLIDKKLYHDKEKALTEIFNRINDQSEKAYINKIKDYQYIEVYKYNSGYVYDSKDLDHIYQILEIRGDASHKTKEIKKKLSLK